MTETIENDWKAAAHFRNFAQLDESTQAFYVDDLLRSVHATSSPTPEIWHDYFEGLWLALLLSDMEVPTDALSGRRAFPYPLWLYGRMSEQTQAEMFAWVKNEVPQKEQYTHAFWVGVHVGLLVMFRDLGSAVLYVCAHSQEIRARVER